MPSARRQSYVAETLRSARTVVADSYAPERGSRRLLVVATPLWDESGKPVGVVAASVGLLRLQEGLRRAELPENSSLLVVDRDGRIVTRRQDPEAVDGPLGAGQLGGAGRPAAGGGRL